VYYILYTVYLLLADLVVTSEFQVLLPDKLSFESIICISYSSLSITTVHASALAI